MTTRCTLLALGATLGLARPALSQTAAPEPQAAAAAVAAKQYNDSFGVHPQLFNGPEYVDYARPYHARIGHQFFLSPEKQRGGVFYNDHYFPNLRLAYDVVLDQVVLPLPGTPLTLRLVNERVHYFTIEGHHFIRLVADGAAAGGAPRTGYYEVLLDDARGQVLARRAKRMQERIKNGFVDVEFIPTERLFFQKAGIYYPLTRKATLVRALADRDQQVQQFIKAQKLSFKKAQFEASAVQLVRYYNTLSPPPPAQP